MLSRDLERVQVDPWILVSCEADEPQLPRLLRLEQRSLCALVVEDPVRILEPQHFVVLNEIDAVGL